MYNTLRYRYGYLIFHLDFAALRAISVRLLLVKAAARAGPPLAPPSLPRATAAGFFPSSAFVSGGAFPVAMSTISFASWFESRGLLERLGIPHPWHRSGGASSGSAGRPISN